MGKIKKNHFECSAGTIAYRVSEGQRGQTVLIHGNSLSCESFERHQYDAPGAFNALLGAFLAEIFDDY
jgi:hypothetical protein